jgi:hypothetical protein
MFYHDAFIKSITHQGQNSKNNGTNPNMYHDYPQKKMTIFYRRVEKSFKSRSGPGVPGVAGVPDVSHLICEGALAALVSERRTFRRSYILGGAVRLGRKSHRLCLKMGCNHI